MTRPAGAARAGPRAAAGVPTARPQRVPPRAGRRAGPTALRAAFSEPAAAGGEDVPPMPLEDSPVLQSLLAAVASGAVSPSEASGVLGRVCSPSGLEQGLNLAPLSLSDVDAVPPAFSAAPVAAVPPQFVSAADKTPAELAACVLDLSASQRATVAVHVPPTVYARVREQLPGVVFRADAGTLTFTNPDAPAMPKLRGTVGIVVASPHDAAAAAEAAVAAAALGTYAYTINGGPLTPTAGPTADAAAQRAALRSVDALHAANVLLVAAPGASGLPALLSDVCPDTPVVHLPSCPPPPSGPCAAVPVGAGAAAAAAARRTLMCAQRMHERAAAAAPAPTTCTPAAEPAPAPAAVTVDTPPAPAAATVDMPPAHTALGSEDAPGARCALPERVPAPNVPEVLGTVDAPGPHCALKTADANAPAAVPAALGSEDMPGPRCALPDAADAATAADASGTLSEEARAAARAAMDADGDDWVAGLDAETLSELRSAVSASLREGGDETGSDDGVVADSEPAGADVVAAAADDVSASASASASGGAADVGSDWANVQKGLQEGAGEGALPHQLMAAQAQFYGMEGAQGACGELPAEPELEVLLEEAAASARRE